eukprot:CAMPEP_0206549112 /NCGR_PEP_ID=MMETSP0325_2-20121206/14271_1 /ASSEMBLY_ACC=CAM_ASM_000347 /TAXON_ID=2866 /ORGANISM="Crypthecodinium cohnii, Strain Seligo" /LENGTH=77 /DNA_ID=CAMNT_0054048693 /DNA_START=252 /DNA_END=485 /DNA_ORIENTATION=-
MKHSVQNVEQGSTATKKKKKKKKKKEKEKTAECRARLDDEEEGEYEKETEDLTFWPLGKLYTTTWPGLAALAVLQLP